MMKEFICIVCPRGCRISVDDSGHISGNQCPRGKTYVETELKSPKRILTTTIKTIYENQPRVSCKTDQPIPKAMIFELMGQINQIIIKQPMSIGDVVIENVLNTGANLVLTKACLGGKLNEEIHTGN